MRVCVCAHDYLLFSRASTWICVSCLFQDFMRPEVLGVGVPFTASPHYTSLPVAEAAIDSVGGAFAGYLHHIEDMPFGTDPSLFGLHPNADISCELAESEAMFESLLSLQVLLSV